MSTPYRIERNWWTPYMLGVFFGYHLPRRSRYVGPPPVYAECPSCRAWVRVLPSGRWARHPDSLLYPVGVVLLLRGRCWRGGRMRS